MSELKFDKSKSFELLTLKEYSEKYTGGVSVQAINYAIDHDKLDFCWVGQQRMIVMTEKTKTYVPNQHPRRGVLGKAISRK